MKIYEIHFMVMFLGKGLKKEVVKITKELYNKIALSLLENNIECEIKQKWNRNYIRIGCYEESYFSLLTIFEVDYGIKK